MKKQLDKVLKDVAENTKKSRGTVPGFISEYLLTLDQIEPPKFDWKGYIRKFTGFSKKTYVKKSRRKENKKFPDSPAIKVKTRQHLLLAIDTSGSVSDDELQEFLNEIHHLYKMGIQITVVQADTRIVSIKEYKHKKPEIHISGRGGRIKMCHPIQ